MRSRFWVAFGALALAFALLVPTLAPLSGSMDSFAHDLANGAFRPFGPGKSPLKAFSGSLGGFSGHSAGNYVPGAAEVPPQWVMDRDGTGGEVVIDIVFNPSLGAMKRLKAYDRLAPDGTTLEVEDKRLRPYAPDSARVRYDTLLDANFQVQLRAGEPTPIFSPHPRALIRTYSTSPPAPGGITFLQDGADTLYALARSDITTTLNISFMSEARYYLSDLPPGMSVDDYPASLRPTLSPGLVQDAKLVLARAGAGDGRDLGATLDALNLYFRSFTEGDIPPPTEVESLYLALALGGHGCCRHRAFAYMVTAQSLGIPARVVVNEAHAFVEVALPDGSWRQFNLGGCGTYTINNPANHRELFAQAGDPRGEANPDENRPLPTVATTTNITESPERIVKGESYFVNGTVESAGGRGVPGARIDIFLNETKEAKGRLTGAGTTDSRGQFSIIARVPRDLPARSYQLVARAQDPGAGQLRYVESWSDPEVSVFAPTQFLFPTFVGAAGFPVNVTGRLVDLDNNTVGGANITWSGEGSGGERSVRAGPQGRFVVQATFPTTGAKTLSFRFAGDEHHGAAETEVVIEIKEAALVLPAEAPTLARGETGNLTGNIAIAGVPLGGRDVRATLLPTNGGAGAIAGGVGRTDGSGAFKLSLPVLRTVAPGVYPVRYDVPALNLTGLGLVRIAIRPTLTLDAPTSLTSSDAWVLTTSLLSDDASEITGGIVEVTVDRNATTTRALLTNRSGVARFEFPAHTLEPGVHALRIHFPGDARHAEASMMIEVNVVRPWYTTVPAWSYAAALAALTSILFIGWLLRPGSGLHRTIAAARQRAQRWSIEASFPDHPAGIAPIAEPDEVVRITLRVRDREGGNVVARLVVDGSRGRSRGRTHGTGWTFEAPAPSSGALVLRARATGIGRLWAVPLEIRVPVQPYRRAVEEGFVALRRRARLADSASPADVVRTLGPRMSSAQQQKLREAASLFEVADYSERPVDRAFYHAFALARRDLERAMEGHADV